MYHRLVLPGHLLVIAALVLFLGLTYDPSADASVGGGFAVLALQALGLPWSVLPAVTLDVNGDWLSSLVYGALAALNAVLLHLVYWRRTNRTAA